MIAIFLRELRENLKWAIVICGVMLVIVCHELRGAGPMFLFQFPRPNTIIAGPLAGLLMGIVQVLFETRPDNWGFVVHRPVRRRRIFAAKCAAGLLLLYAALALPCLIAAAWAARPGNLATPFQWRMLLPMMADVLNAGCYYFAGMVLVLRRARWFGTRLLPLGAALVSSAVITMFAAQFWQAVLIMVIVQTVGVVAAWGVFASNGAADAQATRFALGMMIYPGALGVGLGLFGFSQAFTPGGRWQYYQVDRNGSVVLVTQTIEHGERGWAFTDPAGRPLPQYDGMDLDDPANNNQFVRFNAPLVDSHAIPWPLTVLYANMGYREPAPGVVLLRNVAPVGVRLRLLPVYDVPRRTIDLFDPVTRVQIGTVGPDGFSAGPSPQVRRFEGTLLDPFLKSNSRVLAFDSIVYWMELDQRRVRPVYKASADDPVFSAAELGPPADATILVATRHRLHLLRTDGQAIFDAPLEQDPAKHHFEAALLPSNHHLIVRAYSNPGVAPWALEVLEYSTDGTLVHRTQLPRLTDFRSPKRLETMMFGTIFPVAARPLCPAWILDDVLDIRAEEFASRFEGSMWISAGLCAAITLLIGRRCGFGRSKMFGWSLANLLLGPAGVAVMLGVNDWPARQTCAACGRDRLADRRDCPHCGAPLEPTPLDGREIFDPDDSQAELAEDVPASTGA